MAWSWHDPGCNCPLEMSRDPVVRVAASAKLAREKVTQALEETGEDVWTWTQHTDIGEFAEEALRDPQLVDYLAETIREEEAAVKLEIARLQKVVEDLGT